MRRLFLHIGAHKTGTTALQLGLYQNRAALEAQGISYVCSDVGAHLHHYLTFVSPRSIVPQGGMVIDPDDLANRLAAATQDSVVASSENFSFFFDQSNIAALEHSLRRHFGQIHIMSYLRRQDRHAVSHHQEGAKPGRLAEGHLWGQSPTALPDYTPALDHYLDYNHRLGLWAEVFGPENLILRRYDRATLKAGDIFQDFLDVLGLDSSGLKPIGDKNTSLGATQTKLGHLMNQANLPPVLARRLLDRIERSGRLLPSKAQAQAFLAHYTDSNRRLNARFNISPLPDLFDDDMSDFPDMAQDQWSEAGANAALSLILSDPDALRPPAGPPISPDDLRDAALALQTTAPHTALRLISAAHALRPTGPVILKIKADLENRLAQNPETPGKTR